MHPTLANLDDATLEKLLSASLPQKPKVETTVPANHNHTTDPAAALVAAITAIAGAAAPTVPLNESRVREIAEEAALAAASCVSTGPSEARLIELIQQHGRVQRIEVKHAERTVTFTGQQHKNFELLLQVCNTRSASGHRMNVWLAGPAGTGKTSAASKVAEALGLPCYATGAVSSPEQLVGYVSPVTGQYMSTAFRTAFENGGIMLLDEIDGSDANAMLILNQALANDWYMFPDGKRVARHVDFVCIGAANTWGLGATQDYVGRFKADAAFLDRFVAVEWPIDEDFERVLCGNDVWCTRVQAVRKAVAAKGIRVVLSPRASIYGAALLANGLAQAVVEQLVLRRGITAEQWKSLEV